MRSVGLEHFKKGDHTPCNLKINGHVIVKITLIHKPIARNMSAQFCFWVCNGGLRWGTRQLEIA